MTDDLSRFTIPADADLPQKPQLRKPPRKPIAPDPTGANLVVDSISNPSEARTRAGKCPCEITGQMLPDSTILLTVWADPQGAPQIYTIQHLDRPAELHLPGLDLKIKINPE